MQTSASDETPHALSENVRTGKTSPDCGRLLWTGPFRLLLSSWSGNFIQYLLANTSKMAFIIVPIYTLFVSANFSGTSIIGIDIDSRRRHANIITSSFWCR